MSVAGGKRRVVQGYRQSGTVPTTENPYPTVNSGAAAIATAARRAAEEAALVRNSGPTSGFEAEPLYGMDSKGAIYASGPAGEPSYTVTAPLLGVRPNSQPWGPVSPIDFQISEAEALRNARAQGGLGLAPQAYKVAREIDPPYIPARPAYHEFIMVADPVTGVPIRSGHYGPSEGWLSPTSRLVAEFDPNDPTVRDDLAAWRARNDPAQGRGVHIQAIPAPAHAVIEEIDAMDRRLNPATSGYEYSAAGEAWPEANSNVATGTAANRAVQRAHPGADRLQPAAPPLSSIFGTPGIRRKLDPWEGGGRLRVR